MTRNNRYDFYCYRATVRNQQNKKRKGTQISPTLHDISFSPPPYDVWTTGTTLDTNESPRKNKQNICKCRPTSWKSIVDLYNNQDTTVVWDDDGPNNNNLEDQYRIDDTVKNNNSKKQKKGHLRIHKNKGSYKIPQNKKLHKNIERKNKKVTSNNLPTDVFLENPVIYAKNNQMCQEGLCKKNIQAGKKHSCRCKKVRNEHRRKTTTCTDKSCNIYRICNMPRTCLEIVSSIIRKVKNISQQSIDVNTNEVIKPMFAIRVDSSSLQVLNPNEIKTKVKTFGTIGKNDKCICPSRLEKAKRYGIGETCLGGVCEAARHGKYDKFNCNCAKTALIECCDTTCDVDTSTGKSKKTAKIIQRVTPRKLDKPVFEMVLDNNHMNVLNTGEIHDVLRKASYSDMCPSGICRATANKDRILNCKCLSKKIAPVLHECDKKTCQPRDPKKKSKFYICSKICNSLENWYCNKNRGDIKTEDNVNDHIHNYSHKKAKVKPVAKLKLASTTRNAEVNRSAMTNSKRSRLCFICSRIYSSFVNRTYVTDDNLGADNKKKIGQRRRNIQNEPPKHTKKQKVSQSRPKPKETSKIIKKRSIEIRRKGTQLLKSATKIKIWKRHRSFAEATNKAMSKRMRQKEKDLSKDSRKRETLLLKKEKQKQKAMAKRKKELNKLHSKEEHHLNCLAAFVIGYVNLHLQTLRGIITAVISIITDPIHSYIYTKHRVKDPIGSCKMFKQWLINTWTARDTKITSMVQNSHMIDVLSDHLEDSAIFEMFANKGQTQEERQTYERKKKRRQRRIRKRHEQAVYSCRHTLLMTLRKHPCIWIYHICPFFYPQCLSILSFMNNFFHLILYIAALLCWTPCIMCMELVRAFLCCVVCTQ